VYYEHELKEDIASVLEFSTLLEEKSLSLDDYLSSIE